MTSPETIQQNRMIANIRASRPLSKKYDTLNDGARRLALALIARNVEPERAILKAKELISK